MTWTRPANLRRQVRRLWDRGRILASLATGESMFPLRLALKRPSAAELRDHFDEARSWSRSLRSMPNVRIEMRELRHRVSGANTLPHEVWIDTVEDAATVIGELLDGVLPPESIDANATGVAGFARRYGFRDKPERIRFRILDPAHALLPGDPDPNADGQDVTLDAATFAALDTGVSRVFVTENEINFLAFPRIEGGMVVFGAGYGFEGLHRAQWLSRCRLFYWGDIDTHGFAILDELRSRFGRAESFLMDRATFDRFEPLWGTESSPLDRDLSRLTDEERALYDDLRFSRIGSNLRLEQERIGFEWVRSRLERLLAASASSTGS